MSDDDFDDLRAAAGGRLPPPDPGRLGELLAALDAERRRRAELEKTLVDVGDDAGGGCCCWPEA